MLKSRLMTRLASALAALALAAFTAVADATPDATADDPAAVPAPLTRAFTRVPAPKGIQIRRYNKTQGAQPTKKSRVIVHYHGTLKDGTVFDSSIDRGHPNSFRMDQVVPCWVDALPLLRVGERAQITCPPDTAYALKGSPPLVPPNATLTFEIELLGIE